MTGDDAIQAQLRLLRRRLDRSEVNRARLENQKARSERFYRRVIVEMEQTQQLLRESEQRATEATRAKSQFLANMSHEIRTPLHGVLGLAQLLQRTELDAEQSGLASTLVGSAEVLLGLLDDVLDLSKIEAGRLELEEVSFDLRRTVEETVWHQAESAHRKGLELVCDLDADLPSPARGDPGRLRQVVTNLVANAIKFTDEGEVVVRVVRCPGGVRVAVSDTGPGMDEATLSIVFEAFRQGDGSTTRRFGGTGLGLRIVHELVDRMGGSVRVESTPGVGSTFFVEVPLDGPAGRDPLAGAFTGRRAVVATRSRTQALALARVLAHLGVDPMRTDASNGAAWARRHDADLLFVDRDCADGAMPASTAVVVMEARHGGAGGIPGERTLARPFRFSDVADLVGGGADGPVAVQAEREPPEPHLHGVRVLLAEDNPVNRQVAVRMLEILGCGVVAVDDGQHAIAAFLQQRFDVVLLDRQMPSMDGVEAAKRMRNLPENITRTPIIATTASVLSGDRQECLDAGMDDFLSKPYTVAQLAATISRWVQPGLVDGPVWDEVTLGRLEASLGVSVTEQIVHSFLTTTPALLRTADAAVDGGTAHDVERAVHAVTSSASAVGALALSRESARIEAEARAGRIPADGASRLWAAFDRALSALRERSILPEPS